MPYFTSKPGPKGSNLLKTSWMKLFFAEVEGQMLHYLHILCPDKELQLVTLLNIELSRKIIPQCLRLGRSFFTHMSEFGTINKEDGPMPLHFDKRDIISCVSILVKSKVVVQLHTTQVIPLNLLEVESIKFHLDKEPCRSFFSIKSFMG